MTLPTFLVIGAMKAGTTALHEYLGQQPGVFVSDPKELDFFLLDGSWGRGLDWYASHFERAGDAVAIGESSPNYSKRHLDPGVAGRIADVLPDVRLVYLVRHPVERIVSMYRHLVGDGLESRPFSEAVLGDPDYVDSSRYGFQIEAYLEHFDRSRLIVVRAEDLRDRRVEAVARVLEHIGAGGGRHPVGLFGEPNRTDQRRVSRPRLGRIASIRPVKQLADRSWRARRALRLLTTKQVRLPRVNPTPEVTTELWARLEPDRHLLADLVPGFDGWGTR